MTMKAPPLRDRLAKSLRALAAAGVTPTPAELVWLGLLAEKADRPLDVGVPWVSGAPLCHGGVMFWPLTLQAKHWYLYWHPRFEGNDLGQVLLYAFAHVCSRLGDNTLLPLSEYGLIEEAVTTWFEGLAMTERQLLAVYGKLRLLDEEEETLHDPTKAATTEEAGPVDLDRKVAILCKTFQGTTPQFWRCEISDAEANRLLVTMDTVLDPDPGKAANPNSPKNKAIHNYVCAVKWVLHNHNALEAPPAAAAEGAAT